MEEQQRSKKRPAEGTFVRSSKPFSGKAPKKINNPTRIAKLSTGKGANFWSWGRRLPGLFRLGAYAGAGMLMSEIMEHKQRYYESYTGDASGRPITELVKSVTSGTGLLLGATSMAGFGPQWALGKGARTTGKLLGGFNPKNIKNIRKDPVRGITTAGLYGATGALGVMAAYPSIIPAVGMGIGATYALGVGMAAYQNRKPLAKGIARMAPGTIAFMGAGAAGYMTSESTNRPYVSEGNFEAVYSDYTSPVQKLNYSTAGIVQALHRNRKM